MKLLFGRRYALLAFLLIVLVFVAPANASEPRVIMDVSKAKFLVHAPPPEYPAEALKNHWGGAASSKCNFVEELPWAPSSQCRPAIRYWITLR